MRDRMAERKIGLVLGSGAVRGYALIPIIKRLEEEHIKIIAISGSSAGALVGAYYALNKEIDSFFKRIKKMTKKDYLKLADPNNPKISLFKGKKIKEFLFENYFSNKNFKDIKIPLFICATDLLGMKPVYIAKGKLIDAVMASISIPGFVPPYKIGKNIFSDGGVLDPVPIQPLLDRGIKKVVAINLTGCKSRKTEKVNEGIIAALMNTYYLMMEQLAKREENKRLFVISPQFEPGSTHMLAFHEWKENYEIGEIAIKNQIRNLNKWLES
jgi:NTE family protein